MSSTKALFCGFTVWIILVASCFGALIECQDVQENGRNQVCQVELSKEEIASAFNMNCEPTENGIKCQFETLRNGNPLVKVITPEVAKINACSSSGVCIRSEIQTVLEKQEVGQESLPAHHGVQSSGTAEETTMQPAPAEEIHSSSDSDKLGVNAEHETIEFAIRVGDFHYKEPFDQYADPVTNVLRAKAYLWKTSPRDVAHEYSLGNALFDLGIAHYSTVLGEDEYPGTYAHLSAEAFELKMTVNAFREAEKLYEKILDKYASERYVVHTSLAALYLQWGEVYQSRHYYEEEINTDENTNALNDLSLRYYEKAETHYRLSLATGQDKLTVDLFQEAEINLAHVYHRVGRCLVNSLQGGVLVADTMVGDTATKETPNVLPQIQKLVTVIPKAQRKFEEAMKLYRRAIEEEKEFSKQIELKNNLCQTLQDAGTAASYASNYAKAIELQEEGVDVCKEILVHLKGERHHYMVQYVGDSIYGLSNHYMQLGRYADTMASYQSAMDWYEENDLQPSLFANTFEVNDESLELYEKQLADFLALKAEVSIPDGYVDENSVQYEANDAYEGGLHAALGSLHLSRNELLMAIDHFNQAIRLYENFEGDEELDRSIADVKVSLAAAYFKNREYRKSAEVHSEAMEIYREVVGEGKNPLLAGLSEKLGALGELSDVLGSDSDVGQILDSDIVQELLASLDVEDLAATLQKLTNKKKGQDGPASSRDNNSQPGGNEEGKSSEPKQVHEELFDTARLRQMLLNMTSMKGEL